MKSFLSRCVAALLGALLVAGLLQAVVHAQAPTTRAAVLSSPVIVGDFTAGTLPAGWTLTRASAGARFNSSGVLVSETTDVARFTWDPANLAAGPSLLVEPQRTNLALRSGAIDNVSWQTLEVTVNADAIAAPDGTTSAERINEKASTNGHGVYQNITLTSDTFAAVSWYAKTGTRTAIATELALSANNWAAAVCDLSGQTVSQTAAGATSGTISSSGISAAGGGWFRCNLVAKITGANPYIQAEIAPTASGNTFNTLGDISYLGDTSKNLYLWGAQIEQATDVSSYIPTTNATVTRSADVLTRSGLQNGTYTVIVERVSGTTVLTGQAVSNGTFTAPTDVSGVRKITLRRN